MKKYGIGLTLLVITLVAASFFMMSFHATTSQTTQNSTVASSNGSGIVQKPNQLKAVATNVVVAGSSRLDTSLKSGLINSLPGVAGLGEVTFVDPANIPANAPLLYVQIKEQNVRWTPVYSTAALQVVVAYSDNGDVSFKDHEPTQFNTITSPGSSLQFKGIYQLDDTSWGLMSLPGYQDFLAQNLTQTIMKSVQEQFK
jgi:hypothetical protein